MREVICISIRESNPKQIEKGKRYLIDTHTLYSDTDGDWYVEVYDMDKNKIGGLLLNHFRDI